ncbi:GntR family transcriptional regulator [Tenacibaculum sp. 190524A02b]|uniref:Substrate-binding protein-like domain-containing protein n=1 Tax=Tenacibaculum vairaonense TaxID=3137860 RepID=A0ABP1FJN7_9FLAO
MSIVEVKERIGIPKYRQIISSVENAIVSKDLKKGDKLPSINSIRNKFKLSRDTVLLAYNDLKIRGIIESVPGKGYYVKSESINVTQKIFLLFDELNTFKEDLYNSFLNNLGDNIEVDIFFHHFNYDVFQKLLSDNMGKYNYYVIMPAKLNNIIPVLERLPKDKVYILDQTKEELSEYPAIYQDFEKDIYKGLEGCRHLIKNYKQLIFLFDRDKQPDGLLFGFQNFCKDYGVAGKHISSIKEYEIQEGDAYIIPDDRNLIRIIKKCKECEFRISKEVGIISYNDTLLKEIVEDGITTISTDFKAMGAKLASMLLNKERVQIANSNNLILRKSL